MAGLNRRTLLQVAGAASLGALGGFSTRPHRVGAQAKPGGTLNFAQNVQTVSIDPHKNMDLAGTQIKGLVYSQLLKFYYGGEIVPDVAESYEEVDETTYHFKLREGVMFHDGTPLTADDVVATYGRILNEETSASVYPFLGGGIEEVTAVDPVTVEFKLTGPFPTFISAMALPGNFIAQKAKIDAGVDFETDVVGTGPFTFVSMTEGVDARVAKNPNYFISGLPYLDEVVFRPIPDDPTRVNALYSGAVDIIAYVPWSAMGEVENNPELVLSSNPEDGFLMLDLRVDQPPLDNPLVRQAISYGINREAIINTATSGRGLPCTGGIIPSWMLGYNEELNGTFAYNPEKAKQLLAEADVEGLAFDLITWPPDNELFGRPSVVIANQLQQIGINVTLKPTPKPQYSEARSTGAYTALMDGSLYSLPDPDFLQDYYHTGGVRVAKANRFSDPEIDAWLDEARTLTDPDERVALYNQVQAKAIELQPIVWLVYREQGEAATTAVQGFEYMPRGATNYLLEAWLDR
jgi:ABC-type transport system substrate-binding protein